MEWVHILSIDGVNIAIPANDVTFHRASHLVYWDTVAVRYKSSKTAWELVRQMPNAFVVR